MNNVILEIHKKTGIPITLIREVILATEKFVAEQIKSDDYKNIRIPGLGLFYVEKKALEKINKLKNEKQKL